MGWGLGSGRWIFVVPKKKRAFLIESRNYTNRLLNDKGERKKQHFTTPHPAKALPVNIELEQHLQQDNDLN